MRRERPVECVHPDIYIRMDTLQALAPPSAPAPIVQPLALALVRCLTIVLIGYFCRRTRIFKATDVDGISAFVARIALPVLILLHTATLDVSALEESARLVVAVICAKLVLFAIVVAVTALTAIAATAGSNGSLTNRLLRSPMLQPMRHRVVLRPARRHTSRSVQKAKDVCTSAGAAAAEGQALLLVPVPSLLPQLLLLTSFAPWDEHLAALLDIESAQRGASARRPSRGGGGGGRSAAGRRQRSISVVSGSV